MGRTIGEVVMGERRMNRWSLAMAGAGTIFAWASQAFDPAGPGGSSVTEEEKYDLGTSLFNTIFGKNIDPREVQERLKGLF